MGVVTLNRILEFEYHEVITMAKLLPASKISAMLTDDEVKEEYEERFGEIPSSELDELVSELVEIEDQLREADIAELTLAIARNDGGEAIRALRSTFNDSLAISEWIEKSWRSVRAKKA